jgi:hypothetical protein
MRSHSRRQFLQRSVVLAGFSLLSGREASGQPATKVPRIGFLAVGSRQGRAFLIEGFLQGLRDRGYVEGRNIAIEYRFSEDRDDRLPALAAELVAMKVQLILASGTPASFAAKQATSTIPIVMGGIAADPVETGLVAGSGLLGPGSESGRLRHGERGQGPGARRRMASRLGYKDPITASTLPEDHRLSTVEPVIYDRRRSITVVTDEPISSRRPRWLGVA